MSSAIAIGLALIIAFFAGGAIGVGTGREIVLDSIKTHGRFIHKNVEVVGTLTEKKP